MAAENSKLLRGNLPIVLIWFAVSAMLIFLSREQIASGIGWGPDDQLRQVQLRDWLAGQSWFDTTQYRIGEPDSQPMHWPRWVELPLALIILLLRPLLGAGAAEIAAMVIVPLIGLGLAMWLVAKISDQLFDQKISLLAAALTATAVPLVAQLRPMRIDHHGWQVVLALFALWALTWRNRIWSGLALGVSLAFLLSISLEGAPLTIALLVPPVVEWLRDGDRRGRLFFTVAALLAGLGLFHIIAHGSVDPLLVYCDAVSSPHLLAAMVGAGILLPAIALQVDGWVKRAAILAIAGAGAIAAMVMVAPQCLGGAFEIDPLVRDYWYLHVREGLPVWHQPWKQTVNFLGGSVVVGLAALPFLLAKRSKDSSPYRLFLLIYAFLAALVVALFVQRAASIAAAYALPLMAWLVHQAFLKARQIKSAVVRIVATAGVVFLILPGPLFVSMVNAIDDSGDGENQKPQQADDEMACDSTGSLRKLNALPRSNLLAPFDFGPEILVLTPHNVLSTSHHRNDAAMADQIRIFSSSPDEARLILEARNIRYIATCDKEAELANYAKKHPNGLWAALAEDKKPDWLQTVHLRDSGLSVWRVVPKL